MLRVERNAGEGLEFVRRQIAICSESGVRN